MASTYENNLRLREMGTGDESGTWGIRTNENLELIGEALGYGTEAVSGTTHTTTIADGSTDPGRAMYLKYTGALGANCTITLAPNTISKLWFIENATTDSGSSGPYSIIISQGSGANVTIPNGKTKLVYTDGVGSGAAVVDGFDKIDIGANATKNGGGFSDVTATSVTTFTNKTFDANASGNSITNIENADIKSGAAIDAAKIANGNVSNAEFQYLDGVTSAIQTQLGTKLNLAIPNDAYINSAEGDNRIFYANSGETYFKADGSHIFRNASDSNTATLDTSGNFTATGNVGAYSDMALKEDIYQIENALEKVNQLRGVHFTRKSNNSKEIGVVANEVEKVVPELVDEHEDKELGTVKTMKYANTVGLLIEAVKDLSKQVEELKNDSSN
tara:strand:+ start:988 stop:2154 length:1167 start_codon:yes stop_codon:yes gene_type:complete